MWERARGRVRGGDGEGEGEWCLGSNGLLCLGACGRARRGRGWWFEIDQFLHVKTQPKGNKPHKLCSYSPEPRTEVCCFRLNFRLIYSRFYCILLFVPAPFLWLLPLGTNKWKLLCDLAKYCCHCWNPPPYPSSTTFLVFNLIWMWVSLPFPPSVYCLGNTH